MNDAPPVNPSDYRDSSLESSPESLDSTSSGVNDLRPLNGQAEPTQLTNHLALQRRQHRRLIALSCLVVALVGFTLLILVHKKPDDQVALRTGEFNKTSIPLSAVPQLTNADSAASLRVSGQLQVANSVIVQPTAQPTAPTIGQIYFDKTTKQLRYYDGTKFTGLGEQVTNITNNSFISQTAAPTVLLQASSPGTTQTGNLTISGKILAGSLQGNGSGLTNLSASSLTSGTVSGGLLSGAYGGITGVGTLSGLNVSGNGSFSGTVSGADAASNNQFVTLSQLNAATGGVGGGVGSLNTLVGGLTLQGTSGQVSVSSNGSNTLTLALDSSVTLQGNSFNGSGELVQLDGSGFLPALNAGALTDLNASNLSSGTVPSSAVSGAYNNITGVGTLGSLSVSGSGSFGSTVSGANGVASGDFVTVSQLTGAVGGITDVTALNSLTGGLTLQGTAGQVAVSSNGTDTLTLALDSAVTLQGNSFNGVSQLVKLDGSGHLPALNASALTSLNASNLASGTVGSGVVSGAYGNITGVGTLGSISVTGTGTFGGTVSGADATSNNQFVTLSQLNSTVGGIGDVSSLNSLSGGLTLQGTSGHVSVASNGTDTLTLDLDSSVTLQGNSFNGVNQLVKLDGSGHLPALNGSALTNLNASNLATGTVSSGVVSGSYGNITGVGTLGSLSVTGTGSFGSTVSGADAVGNGDFVTLSQLNSAVGGVGGGVGSLNTLVGGLTLQGTSGHVSVSSNGTNTLTLDLDSSVTLQGNSFNGVSQLVKLDGSGHLPALNASALTNLNASNLASGTVGSGVVSGNYGNITGVGTLGSLSVTGTGSFGSTVSGADAVGNSDFVTLSQLNSVVGGVSAVTALNSLTGGLSLQGTAGQLSVSSNGTDTLTLALDSSVTLQGNSFNGANQLVQLNGSGQLPALDAHLLTSLNATNLSSGTVASGRISGAYTGITSVGTLGALSVSGTATLGAVTVTNDAGIGGDITVGGGGTFTGTVSGADAVNSNDFVTKSQLTGAVGGVTPSLQAAYDNSSTPATIGLSSTNKGITIKDAGTTVGGNLFAVQDSAGTSKYLAVTTSGINVAGTGAFSGTVSGADAVSSGDFVTLSQLSTAVGGVGGGVASVGTIDTGTYSDNGASISGTTIYLQAATATHTGLVTHGTQTFGGDKTFGNNVIVTGDLTAATLQGDGSGLTNLNASNLATGTVSNGLLSGAYTGITQVGTLSGLDVTGNGTFSGTVSGADAVSSDQFVTLSQLSGAVGGIGGVSSLNSLSGGLTLQGTSGHVSVSSNGTDTLTLDLDSSVTLQGNSFNGVNQLVQLDGSGHLPALNGSALTNLNASNLATGTVGSGLLTGSYTGITAVGTLTSLTTSGQITSTVTTGTAPLVVASTTKVTNLNADLLDGLDSTSFAASSGSGNYIQAQASTPGTAQNTNFNIGTGIGIAAVLQGTTSVQTPLLDTASAVALNIGTTNATVINLNKNTTIAAGKSLILTGSGTRPLTPSEGTLYYDTSQHQLLVYNGTKWVGDHNSATKIVAANNSTQAEKDSADYVANGTTDQTAINAALTAAAGGTVLLLPGAYVTTGTLLIPDNTTLSGSGANTTTIQLNVGSGNDNLIENSNTTTGGGVSIENLYLDDSLATGGTQNAIYLAELDNGASYGTSKLTGLVVNAWNGDGLALDNAELDTFSGNNIGMVSLTNGAYIDHFVGNETATISLDGSFIETFSGNDSGGVSLSNTSGMGSFSGNYASYLNLDSSAIDIIGGNDIGSEISLTNTDPTAPTTISGNHIFVGGSDGISLTNSSNNTISGNSIFNSGSATYAIDITDSASSGNHLSNNTLGGLPINDSGTGTVYGGQVNGSGDYVIKPTSGSSILLQGGTTVTGNLTQSGGAISLQGNAASTIKTTSGNLTVDAAAALQLGSTNATSIAIGHAGATTTVSGNLTAGSINTTAGQATALGNTTGALTFTGNSGTTFAINGVTVDASEFNLLDTKNAPLVDTNDAVATAITGTGALTTGSINWSGAIATSGNISTSGTGTITSAGVITANGGITVANTGSLSTAAGASFTAPGISNNAALSTAGFYTLDTSGAAQIINGIAAGRDGQQLTLTNINALAATLSNNSGVATGKKIITGTATDISLPTGVSAELIYDATNTVWRIVSAVAGNGSGVTSVGAISGTSNANGGSVSGTILTLTAADNTNGGVVTTAAQTFAGLKTFQGGVTSGNINTTAAQATSLGNSTGALTITGNASSTFVINGSTIDATEFALLDTKNAPLVDTNDAVATAITGTGALTTGSINWSGAIATSGNISTSGSGTITSAGLLTASGGLTAANINTTAAQATSLGNATGAFTFTGNSSSTFVVNGVTVDASEFNLLDTKNAPLVDTNDAVATAITGTGALTAGSINWSGNIATSGNISTSGTGTITSAGDINTTGYYRQAGQIVIDTTHGTSSYFLFTAGNATTTGSSNLGAGNNSLGHIGSGSDNIGVGNNTLNGDTTGANNVGVGQNNFENNAVGNNNTALGAFAGQSHHCAPVDGGVGCDVNNETLIGYHTGYLLQEGGDGNTLLGYSAGSNITTGANNIIIGQGTSATSATVSNQLNIGGLIYGDLSGGHVSIGNTSTSTYALNVTGDTNTSGVYRVAGTSGATTTCSGGQVLQNQVVLGGIVTGGTCASAAVGSFVSLQGSTPGIADIGSFNINGTGIAATMQGSTSVLTPLLDTPSAVALNIGTTNATAINLNQNITVASGKTFTVTGGAISLTGASSGDAATISNSTSTGNILVLKDNSTTVATVADGGAATFQNSSDTTSAFNVKNSGGTSVLNIDTDNQSVNIDNGTSIAPLSVGKSGNATYAYGFESGFGTDYTNTNATWIVSNDGGAHTGTWYAKTTGGSGSGSGPSNGLALTKSLTTSGTISFYAKCTSSGAGFYDFWIDSTSQGHLCGGPSGWTLFSFTVSSGTHMFTWNAHSINGAVDDINITNVQSNGVSAVFDGYVGIGINGSPAYDLTFGSGADRTIEIQGQTATNTAGNALTMQSATGNGTGAGGALTLQAGTSGSGATGNGGLLTLQGGNAASTNGNGGNLLLAAGAGTGTGSVGSIIVKSPANSTTAFVIQNATSGALFTADTSTMTVTIGGTAVASTVQVSGTNGFDTTSSGNLNIGLTNASSVTITPATTFSGNVSIATGKYLSLAGGITSSRPAGTEGMLYYDTTEKQLLVYANSKWQADRSTATKIVSDGSTSQNPESGDFMVPAASTSAQTTINNAIAALPAGGGTVFLREGTFIISGSISLPSNVKLVGSGDATIIRLANGTSTTFPAIVNSNTSTGNTNITVSALLLDGNRTNVTGTQQAIKFTKVGSGSGGSAVNGSRIEDVSIIDFTDDEISLITSNNNTVTNVSISSGNGNGITLNGSSYNTVTNANIAGIAKGILLTGASYNNISGSNVTGNGNIGFSLISSSNNNQLTSNVSSGNTQGFTVSGSVQNTLTANTSTANSGTGFTLTSGAESNSLTANQSYNNGSAGFTLSGTSPRNILSNNVSKTNTGPGFNIGADSNTVIGNLSASNTTYGIYVDSASDIVSNNKVYDNGGIGASSGINLTVKAAGDSIINNSITGTTSTGHAINIVATASGNTLSGNTYSGPGATDIADAGTGTIYGGQMNSSGAFLFQATGGLNISSATTIAANLIVTNAGNVAFQKGSDFSTVGSSNDVNFGTGALFRLTGASGQTLTGILGGADGRVITLINAANQSATLVDKSQAAALGSAAADRISTGTGANLTLSAGASVNLVYDSTSSLWRVVGTSTSVGGGSFVSLQGGTPGTADSGNFNISGTGIAATIQGTTSVVTPLLDTASAGTLSIGTATATSISIGHGTIATAITGNVGITNTNATTTLSVSSNTTPTSAIIVANDTSGSGTDTLLSLQASGTPKFTVDAAGNVVALGTLGVSQDASFSGNITVAAGKSLSLAGGITSSRPASPSEGMLYYDTTTKQLLVYANGKWQADRSTATRIVGTSASGGTSSAVASTNPDGADYVNTSTSSAEATINAALLSLPATGGTVYLMDGTYIIDGGISIPDNVTLAGAGAGTIIRVVSGLSSAMTAISNSDTTTGTSITLRDMVLDGNRSTGFGTIAGVNFTGVGNSATTPGVTIKDVVITSFKKDGLYLKNTSNSNITGSTFTNISSSGDGVDLDVGSTYLTFSGNKFYSNTTSLALNETAPTFNTITGNTFTTSSYGIIVTFGGGNQNTITGNTFQANNLYGIRLGSSFNVVSSNVIADSGGTTNNEGIRIDGNSNTITDNNITDSSATTTNNAINNVGNNNYISNNLLGTGIVSNFSATTIMGGQLNGSGVYTIQDSTGIGLSSPTTITNTTATTSLAITTNTTPTNGVITASSTSGTGTDKLINLQSGKFTVDATGNLVALGSLTIGSSGQLGVTASGNLTTTGTLQAASLTTSGNITATNFFQVDTTNSKVVIGTGSATASPVLLVLGNGNSTDPTGSAGAMYYNSSLGAFRCFDTAWKNCINGIQNNVTTAMPVSTLTTGTAGQIWIVPIYISGQMTANQIRVTVTTALATAGDVGLYNSSGTLVLNGGSSSVTVGTGLKTLTPTQAAASRVLEAGQYYAAFTTNGATGAVAAGTATTNIVTARYGTLTGGGLVLPPSITLGSITAANFAAPAISFNN